MRPLFRRYFLLSELILLSFAVSIPHMQVGDARHARPNVIVILTDDQDVHLGSMDYMDGVKYHLQDQGTTYKHHYCTVSLCCPSRVNMWTSKAAHNTNVTDLGPPFGGYPKFVLNGWNEAWLPVWLQRAGYKTYYTGKLMNSHNVRNYNNPPVNGLTGHDFLLEPGTYRYINPIYQRNDEKPKNYPGQYTTDLLIQKSLDFIKEGATSGSPFFIAIAPLAPHASSNPTEDDHDIGPYPPVSATKYAHLFSNATVPRTANFNPDVPSGASWIKDLPKLSDENIAFNDEWYRLRLRSLQSVDELVNATIDALESHGVLENTYIVYTSDNGFHISQHRLEPGKRCPYEEDINVPFVIRGPNIPSGAIANFVTSHTDLVPTILQWTGVEGPDDLDGQVIPLSDSEATSQNWEHVQVEHWGIAPPEGRYGDYPYPIGNNNTYKAIRVIGKHYNLYYAVWCNNDHELYDMTNDPGQMENLYGKDDNQQILGVSINTLQMRLDALLLVLKSCAASTCYKPWSALHPAKDSNVNNLKDALNKEYDQFYKSQNKVKYDACKRGYISEVEQPEDFKTYGESGKIFEKMEIDFQEDQTVLKF